MFKTHAGPVEDDGHVAYLRPETAQGMFTNFANVLGTTRKKPPFGIAQVGKSFRNEITPQNFVFRTREFEQMELEYFVPPAESGQWFDYWLAERMRWYLDLGIPAEKLRLRHHDTEELSHYSRGTADVEFRFPWGWDELEGIANRGDYDLTAHAAASGVALDFFDQQTNERYTPHVIEPAAGATRTMMAFLLSAYAEDEVGGEARTVLRLHWRLAPYQVAVLPLSKKDTLEPLARQVLGALQPHFMCDYDVTQCIGRRYRRQDEIGHAMVCHGGLRLARGRRGHRARPRHHRAGPRSHRRPGRGAAASHRGGWGRTSRLARPVPPRDGRADVGRRSLRSRLSRARRPDAVRLRLRPHARPPSHGAQGPPGRQGRQPGRDDVGTRAAGAARLHHLHRRVPRLHGPGDGPTGSMPRWPGRAPGSRAPWAR